MKTILLVPCRDDSDVFDAWSEHIYNLDPKPDKTIFCENNSTDDTLNKITNFKLPHELIRFWSVESKNYDLMAHARDLLLTRTRQLDPDYAIFICMDVLLKSPNMISILTEWKKDIVSGTPLRPNREDLCLPVLFYPSVRLQPISEEVQIRIPSEIRGYVEHVAVRHHPKTAFQEVYVVGMECVCLSRNIIQDKRLSFYPVIGQYSEDFSFCIKARKLGYEVYLDSTAKLLHPLRTEKKRFWDTQNV